MESWRLPNADSALVEPAKVQDYLLVFRETSDKSEFFQRFGFRRDHWEVLREALLQHARSNPVVRADHTLYGVNYVVEGPLMAADGRWPRVLTIWQIGPGRTIPRFLSAYPS